jgi:hypothetical protein
VLINAGAALLALAFSRAFGWTYGATALAAGDASRWAQVAAAGLGALALLRSSFLLTQAGGRDVLVGPSDFLKALLDAADSEVDRKRAQERAAVVRVIMANVPFRDAQEALPTLCLALMQNLPKEDQEQLAKQVHALREAKMDDASKAINLGLAIINVMGEGVLRVAVDTLRSQGVFPAAVSPPTAPPEPE